MGGPILNISIINQDLRPSMFTNPLLLPESIRNDLIALYQSPDKASRCLASMINHCFTSRVTAVLVSKGILNDMIQDDENHKQKFVLDSSTYKRLSRVNRSGPVFCLSLAPAQELQKRYRLASVYVVLDHGLYDLLALSEQEKQGQVSLLRMVINSYYKKGISQHSMLYDPNELQLNFGVVKPQGEPYQDELLIEEDDG